MARDTMFWNYVRGMVCAMVVIPLVFLAGYPVAMVLVSERLAILADLPRDLTVLVLLEVLLLPVFFGCFYWRARRRAVRLAKDGVLRSGSVK